MEIKKSEKASLENKKLLFLEIGLVVSLAITLFAFEWTSTETNVSTLEAEAEIVLEEEQDDTPVDAFDQDKDLVDSDTEDLHTPLNETSGGEMGETLEPPIDEPMEYDDTDDLEDSYEDDDKSV